MLNIMKKITILFLAVACIAAIAALFFFGRPQNEPLSRKAQSIKDAAEWEFERTKDPALGYPPVERLLVALEQTRQRQDLLAGQMSSRGAVANPRWRERGPNNIGGRTRVILIDRNDPSRKTVWAAGVAGGLWKTTDIDAQDPQWQKINDYKENMAIGAMAQDPSNPLIMYVGTGEGFPNWDAVAGLGVFKTTDGGESWQLLPATLNGQFRFTRGMIVTPQGHVYAANSTGLFRSQDGGASWTKVLGSGLGANDSMFDIVYASNGALFASTVNHIYRSFTGNPNDWERISQSPIPTNLGRLEIAVCDLDPDVIYCIGNQGGGASNVFVTTNGGQTWAQRARPENNNGSEFTNGQAWYDLEITVDHSNCNHLIAGGVPLRRSTSAAFSWEPFGQGIHVDHHKIVFDEEDPTKVYFGNDGGIYRVLLDGAAPVIQNKNLGYNVTQYYACAMHPDAFSSYFLGGTQDNGSHQLNEWNLTSARNVWGGDGFMFHIDQNDPNIQVVSSQYANWGVSYDGGASFIGGQSLNGGFYTPSDYDNESKILYSQTNDGDFYRWNLVSANLELVDISNINSFGLSHIRVDENVPNRVYFCGGGQIVRVDDAHTGADVTGEVIGTFGGTISSIDIELGNPDHIIVTFSNYGLTNNIFETKNGGASWQGVEGPTLPDMPVRWGIFNPNDASQAMIATEAGVWTTELLDGNQTEWFPPMPGKGIPLVRTDMLQTRASDKMVLACTHARGMFTTDVFSDPVARMDFNQVHYVNSPMTFQGDLSLGADSWAWTLGDGTASNEENLEHTFTATGEYPVSLTVNGDLTTQGSVKVLPQRPLPFAPGQSAYGGDFEGFTEQYGVYHLAGTSFVRGKSTLPYKSGTKSGENAFVVGIDGAMAHNTHTMLYLPEFDLSAPGIYEFSFWAKFDLEAGKDGFRVEYSQDGGNNWDVLGAGVTKDWYNTTNNGIIGAVFPNGSTFFSRRESDYKRFFLNISNLAGAGNVAFRFVARTNSSGASAGLAIDDVTITRYEGELATELLDWNAAFSASTQITLDWKTLPEYFCKRFEVERSENGKDFFVVQTLNATGGSTAVPQDYSHSLLGQRNLYFFRLKVINEDQNSGYSYEFYSPVRTVRRNLSGTEVFAVSPNPFTNYVDVAFTDVVNGTVTGDIFDAQGRLISRSEAAAGGLPSVRFNVPYLAAGVYFLRVQIEGEQEAHTVKLLKIN
jgi:hypothetical protein